jgi:ABC-type transporter Mla MlaB component
MVADHSGCMDTNNLHVDVAQDGDQVKVILTGALDAANIRQLHQGMRAARACQGDVEVDVANLSRADAMGVYALTREAGALRFSKRNIEVTNSPPRLTALFRTLSTDCFLRAG